MLALIDPVAFEPQVKEPKANALTAKANLEKSKAALLDSKRTYERNKELFSQNLIAQSDMDTSETNYLSANALEKRRRIWHR